MIISHAKRFVFFRIPKTGSTTAQVMLRMSSAFNLETDLLTPTEQWLLPGYNVPMLKDGSNRVGNHMTPERLVAEGLLTVEQLHEYDCYAFCRDTHSRFVSAYIHDKGPNSPQPSTFLKKIEEGLVPEIVTGILGRKQVDYFFYEGEQVVQPVDFGDYESSLRYLVAMAGGHHFDEIPKINVTGLSGQWDLRERKNWGETVWDFEPVRGYIREAYREDREFYQANFGEGHADTGRSTRDGIRDGAALRGHQGGRRESGQPGDHGNAQAGQGVAI